MWIDTHTHLYSSKFDEDRAERIQAAKDAGVSKVFLPSIDKAYFPSMEKMEQEDPSWVQLMMGLHPCSVGATNDEELSFIKDQLKKRPFAAIGEIGIDLYWDKTHAEEQKRLFCEQCDLALEYNLPIVIHVRDAFEEIFIELEKYRNTSLTGIFHCFTGGKEELEKALDLGFKVGLGGVLTFKNGGLDKLFAQYDRDILNHIVLETDSPYLAPQPYRGKRNETAYLPLIGEKLASIFEIPEEEIAMITSKNAEELFKSYQVSEIHG
jgi:TatD DNase family protein